MNFTNKIEFGIEFHKRIDIEKVSNFTKFLFEVLGF